MNRAIAFVGVFLSIITADAASFAETSNLLPADVDAFILRRDACQESLTTTANGDAAANLRCDALAQDETALRQRYSRDHRVISALDLPADVNTFISRRAHCQRLSATANAAAIAALKCNALAQDEAGLRRQYSADHRVISALDSAWKVIVIRVPVQTEPTK